MQVDVHYYGTYAIAGASEPAPNDCRVIAAASQFLDNSASTWETAHQPY